MQIRENLTVSYACIPLENRAKRGYHSPNVEVKGETRLTAECDSSMQNQAYQFIRKKIERCEYAPNDMLSESLLREELGFSRTPVREAIGRLAQEGLVRVYPKRGIMVSAISIGDIHQIFEVRALVEPYALTAHHDKLDLAAIARFAEFFHSYSGGGESSELYGVDDRFHETLISAIENDYLLELYDRIHVQSVRLRVLSGRLIESRIRDTMAEHARIADACLARDWQGAALAMTEHLRCSKESSLAAILKNSGQEI